jgi:hypothetical protein
MSQINGNSKRPMDDDSETSSSKRINNQNIDYKDLQVIYNNLMQTCSVVFDNNKNLLNTINIISNKFIETINDKEKPEHYEQLIHQQQNEINFFKAKIMNYETRIKEYEIALIEKAKQQIAPNHYVPLRKQIFERQQNVSMASNIIDEESELPNCVKNGNPCDLHKNVVSKRNNINTSSMVSAVPEPIQISNDSSTVGNTIVDISNDKSKSNIMFRFLKNIDYETNEITFTYVKANRSNINAKQMELVGSINYLMNTLPDKSIHERKLIEKEIKILQSKFWYIKETLEIYEANKRASEANKRASPDNDTVYIDTSKKSSNNLDSSMPVNSENISMIPKKKIGRPKKNNI